MAEITMEADPLLLRENALLLINRERELFALRNKHQRLLNWLAVTQSLPEIVQWRYSVPEICQRFCAKLVDLLNFQKALFLEVEPTGVRRRDCFAESMRPLPPESAGILGEDRSGVCNDPTTKAELDLARALRLHRFIWYRMEIFGQHPVLLVGGYDEKRAPFYAPLEREDVEHFEQATRHLESLLRNLLLVRELEADRVSLEDFNEELERRVQERTEELARAHQETAAALEELRLKDQRLQADLLQARTFQQGILPTLPVSPGLEFAAAYRPVDQVGGDIYDISAMGDGRYRCFMADATGHGVQASLRTIAIKIEYDRLKTVHPSLVSLMQALNHRLIEHHGSTEMLSTACCFDIQLSSTGAGLTSVSAAHPPFFLVSGSKLTELYESGPFLGLSPQVSFREASCHLAPGDLLVAYSDGFSDQTGPDRRPFALGAAIEKMSRHGLPLPEAVRLLEGQFDEFRGSVPQEDDLSLIAIRVR